MPTMPHMALSSPQNGLLPTTAIAGSGCVQAPCRSRAGLEAARANPVVTPPIERDGAVGTLIRRRPTTQTLLLLLSGLILEGLLAPSHDGAELCGPARPLLLPRALERQRIGLHTGGDDATGADVGTIANLDGRHKRGVGAYEGPLTDVGEVLVEAVVVAEDRARTDVGAFTHPSIADVGQVVGLGSRLHGGVLHLNEVADVRAGADVGPRAQASEGPNPRAPADAGADDMAIGEEVGAVLDHHAWSEEHIGLDRHVTA